MSNFKKLTAYEPCSVKYVSVGGTSYIEQLETENAKLRELVKAMTPFLRCMPFASCNTLAANVRERIHGLGIEVDA